jgi:hypothetical protein
MAKAEVHQVVQTTLIPSVQELNRFYIAGTNVSVTLLLSGKRDSVCFSLSF